VRQTPTRLELLWGLSGLAVEAGRPAEAQPSVFFPLSQAGSTADESKRWKVNKRREVGLPRSIRTSNLARGANSFVIQ